MREPEAKALYKPCEVIEGRFYLAKIEGSPFMFGEYGPLVIGEMYKPNSNKGAIVFQENEKPCESFKDRSFSKGHGIAILKVYPIGECLHRQEIRGYHAEWYREILPVEVVFIEHPEKKPKRKDVTGECEYLPTLDGYSGEEKTAYNLMIVHDGNHIGWIMPYHPDCNPILLFYYGYTVEKNRSLFCIIKENDKS